MSLRLGKRAAAVIAAIALLIGALGTTLPAHAAVLEGAVTSVQLREDTADQYDTVHIDIDWRVPTGTKAGDTFTVELPASLEIAEGRTAELKVPGTDVVVANAAVVGGKLVVTMTSFAESHINVQGTAWVQARFTSAINVGASNALKFTVGSATFTDDVLITAVPGDPGAIYKWGALQHDTGKRIVYGIRAGRPEGSNYDITISDTASAGIAIDCSSLEFWGVYYTPGGEEKSQWMADDERQMNGWKINSCTETGFSVTYTVANWHATDGVQWVPHVVYLADVTDASLAKWDNSGLVTYPGNTEIRVQTSVQNPAIGGDGSGDQPPSPSASPSQTTPAPKERPGLPSTGV